MKSGPLHEPSPEAHQARWFELMQFYIREAWLLDERRFREWLDIFTDDVLYFMPRRKNVLRRELHREVTPLGDLAILEEDRRYLEMRVARLETGMAWAEDPPSRTRHLIGNLEAAPLENGALSATRARSFSWSSPASSCGALTLPSCCSRTCSWSQWWRWESSTRSAARRSV